MNSATSIVSDYKQNRRVPLQAVITGRGPDSVSPVTVFVIDDDPVVRQTLQLLMESAGFRAECFASAEEFQGVFDSSNPDCIVIDIGLPGMSGLDLLEELHRNGVTTPMILFSGSDDAVLAVQAIKAGAQDYCAKSRGPTALLNSVRKAIKADRGVSKEFDDSSDATARTLKLTPRERDVLELLVSGKTNQQVAELLGISIKTVATHRASLMRKTRSDSLATLPDRRYAD